MKKVFLEISPSPQENTCARAFFKKEHLFLQNTSGGCFWKALEVLLVHLFVTLLINKAPGSDNRHFLFNILENENREEFLTSSTFCTFEVIEKSISLKRLSQDTLSKVHLNKYGFN